MNKLLQKVAKLFLGLSMAAGVGVAVSAGRKDASAVNADSYTIITDVSDLSNGDKVIVATENGSNPETGVTGWNGSKDATVGATPSGWVQYEVTTATNGWYLYDSEADKYIKSPGSGNNFYYGSSSEKAVCSVDSNGVLKCNSRFLCKNGTNYRMYGSIGTYIPFYVWKVSGSGGSTDGTATYTVSSKTAATTTGTTPQGSSITYSNNGTNGNDQMISGKKEVWTIKGYTGKKITSFKADLRNNQSSGSGTAALTNNSSSVTLARSSFSGLGSTYAEYELLSSSITVAGDLVLTLTGTANSFFCDYLKIAWEDGGFTVTYNGNGNTGGTVPTDPEGYSSGTSVTVIGNTGSLVKTGYTFAGWTLNNAGTGTVYGPDYTTTISITENINFYAKWAYKTSALTFNLNGGTGTAPTGKTATYGSAMPAYGQSAPTKTGYTFGGFYDGSGGTGTQYYTAALASAKNWDKDVTTGTTLYAKWIAKTSELTFNLNGGTGTAPTGKIATYGSAMPAYGQSAPTKTGHTFAGFYDGEGGTGNQYYTAGLASATNWNKDTTDGTTLYAKWDKNSYTVTGTISNGSLSSDDNVDYNDPLSITIVPDTANDYTYPSSIESVTMGGDLYNGYTYDSTDGSFYIEHVTGNVEIVAHCVDTSATPCSVDYELDNCSITNAPDTIYSNEIKELQIVADDHFKFPNSISITGIASSKWTYDSDEGTILINEPDDDMVISVECVAKETYDITLSLTNVTKSSGPSGEDAVEEGEEVTIVFVANPNYGLPSAITVEMGEDTLTEGDDYTWTQGTGTLYLLELTDDLTVTISGVARDLTNGTLTLGTKQIEYTLGDDFVKPSTITANFNLAPLTVDVKNDVVVTGPVENGVVTGSGTVTLTYTFAATGHTQSASYAITAAPISPSSEKFVKVESGTVTSGKYLIVNETAGVAFNGGIDSSTYDATNNVVDVTISEGEIAYSAALDSASFTFDATAGTLKSAAGYYVGRTASSTGINASTDTAYTNTISVSDGTATIQASNNYVLRYNGNSGQNRFRYYSGASVDPVQIYKYQEGTEAELKWITAEVNSGTYYQGSTVTASNFTVTAHYNDGTTSTPTSGITVTNGYLANIGANSVTLTYGGKSCTKTVNAVEQTATLTGLTWAQGEYTIIDGQTIDFSELGAVTASYDIGDSSTKPIASCTVSTYTKSNDIYTKVADIDDGDTITSSSHGKYLGVTYTEKAVTKVAYSSAPIYVVEAINDVYTQVASYTWSKVTSINDGDIVTFVEETDSIVASSKGSNIINATTYEETVTTSFYFTVGEVIVGNNTYYTFHNEDGYLGNHSTGTSGNNYAYLDEEIDKDNNKNYFTVDFDEGDVVITSVYDSDRTLQLRSGATKDRFCFYGSSQLAIQLYKGTTTYVPSGESFANTNVMVQKAVLEFAEHFNDTMQCINGGTTANVSSKWTTLSGDFTSALSEFSDDNLQHFKDLFANAYSVEGGDTLQDMLARYDYIVAKYKLSDFLNSSVDRPQVAQSPHVSPLIYIIGENTNTVAIIVIISMVSVTAIGGYFFLRKRKENI